MRAMAEKIVRMRMSKLGGHIYELSKLKLICSVNVQKSVDRVLNELARWQIYLEMQMNPPGRIVGGGLNMSLLAGDFLKEPNFFLYGGWVQTAKYILLKNGTIKNKLGSMKNLVEIHQECLVVDSEEHQPELDKILRNSVLVCNELNRLMNEEDLEGMSKKKVDLNEMLADKKLLNIKDFAKYMQFLSAMMISILETGDGSDGNTNELYFSCWLNFHLLS